MLIRSEQQSLPFEQQLLAEQIHAIEDAQGPEDQPTISSHGRDFLTWLRLRNEQLQKRPHVAAAINHAPQIFQRLLWGVSAVVLMIGAVTSVKALGHSATQLNIFWVLGALLGLSWLSFLLWLVTLLLNPGRAGVVAPLFSHLLNRLLPAHEKPTALQAAGRVWLRWKFISPSGAMRSSWIAHWIWSVYLLGGLVGLLLLFSTRQFDFVWESTLLSGDAFVRVTRLLAHPLEVLGLPVPEASQVLASSVDSHSADGAHVRRLWAQFLMSCVLIYGLLPRLLAGAVCFFAELHLRSRARLNLNHPYYVRLQREFWPLNVQSRVLDPDDSAASPAPLDPAAAQRAVVGNLPEDCFWIGVELPARFTFPAAIVSPAELINIRDENSLRQALAQLERRNGTVAVLIDGNKSADRGILRIILQIAQTAGPPNTWLVLQPKSVEPKLASWLQVAARAGLTPEQVTWI